MGPQLVVEDGFAAEDGGSLSPGLAVEQVGDRLRVDVSFGGRVNGGRLLPCLAKVKVEPGIG